MTPSARFISTPPMRGSQRFGAVSAGSAVAAVMGRSSSCRGAGGSRAARRWRVSACRRRIAGRRASTGGHSTCSIRVAVAGSPDGRSLPHRLTSSCPPACGIPHRCRRFPGRAEPSAAARRSRLVQGPAPETVACGGRRRFRGDRRGARCACTARRPDCASSGLGVRACCDALRRAVCRTRTATRLRAGDGGCSTRSRRDGGRDRGLGLPHRRLIARSGARSVTARACRRILACARTFAPPGPRGVSRASCRQE